MHSHSQRMRVRTPGRPGKTRINVDLPSPLFAELEKYGRTRPKRQATTTAIVIDALKRLFGKRGSSNPPTLVRLREDLARYVELLALMANRLHRVVEQARGSPDLGALSRLVVVERGFSDLRKQLRLLAAELQETRREFSAVATNEKSPQP
jgi:hypothetical protein